MRQFVARLVVILVALGFTVSLHAELGEKRIALVVGNAAYEAGALPTSANDAGLIAQTLQAAGFDVVGARDLDQESLRRAFRDFLEKATRAGQGTVAFVYLAGYALQLEGENYFIPVDAKIGRDSDVAAQTVRLSDYIRPLGALDLKTSVVVLDAARKNPFAMSGPPIAGGLALIEPSPGMVVAFNAAPGTVAPEQSGPYGSYAQALAEMMREGGLSLSNVFERLRLRVNDMTKGAQVPWNSTKGEASFVFFERAVDAPLAATEQSASVHAHVMRDLSAADAYQAALERDTLPAYEEFVSAYPADPMARRVRAMIAARREAITWRQTYETNTPEAYWSYLTRYPEGPHVADARRRLAQRASATEPPASYTPIDYSVAPPPAEEIAYVRRPVLAFYDPYWDFLPPPPVAAYFLPPPPPEFVVLLAPPPPIGFFLLPVPIFVALPLWCAHPPYLVAPPQNVFFNNIHNTVIVNNVTNVVTIKNQSGQVISSKPVPGANAVGPALPPSLAKTVANQPQTAGATSGNPAQQSTHLSVGHGLPGMNALPPKSSNSGAAARPHKNTTSIQTQAPAGPPASARHLAHRAAPSPQMHPSPPSTYRAPTGAAVRSFSPPPASMRPAAPRAAAAPARKPPGH
jgi:uncharacterized caspase-like protein